MKNLFFVFALLICSSSISQNDESYVDGLIQGFTQKLHAKGISSYYVTKRYCSGKVQIFKIGDGICSSRGTYIEAYVVWKEDEKAFFKKIDNCGMFHTVTATETGIYDLFDANTAALEEESVKKYKSAKYTGEPELRTTPQPCGRKFDFTVNGRTFSKEYNLFDISNDSKGKNLNYDYNQALKIVQLDNQFTTALTPAEPDLRRLRN